MATDTAPATLRGDFVTPKLLALAALIFLLNLPTLTVLDSLAWQVGFAVVYLGGALVMATLAKALVVVLRHGLSGLTE
jgi:hypothetical protein